MEDLGKDLRGYLGQKLDERDFLNYCSVNKEMCNDESYKLYLFNSYPDKITKLTYDKNTFYNHKTWKQYFLMYVYYKSILIDVFGRKYKGETVTELKDLIDELIELSSILVLKQVEKGNLEGLRFLALRKKIEKNDPNMKVYIDLARSKGYNEIVTYLENL